MDETSRVVNAIHFLVRDAFAEEELLLETLFLALAVSEADILMLSIHKSRVRIVLVGTKIIEELLIGSIHHNMTLILNILVVKLRDSKRVGLGVLVVATQYTSSQHVFVEQISEATADHVVPRCRLKRQRSAFEGCLEHTAFDAFTSRQELVDGQIAFADQRAAGNAQQRPMSRFACERY